MSTSASRLIHLVLFKFKSDATDEQIHVVFDNILALKSKIPEIIEVTVGANITDRSKGYTHAITVIFKDAADLKIYADHAEHQKVITDFIMPIKEDILAIDYLENKY